MQRPASSDQRSLASREHWLWTNRSGALTVTLAPPNVLGDPDDS